MNLLIVLAIFFAGACFGVFMAALMIANGRDDDDR